jgi:hypothetical protein
MAARTLWARVMAYCPSRSGEDGRTDGVGRDGVEYSGGFFMVCVKGNERFTKGDERCSVQH